MNRFKYFVGPGLFREYSRLFMNLDAALLAMDGFATLGLVPSGHPPWKPFIGRPAHETSPFRAELLQRPWEVVRVYTYREGDKTETFIAEFMTPGDAFAFATMKAEHAKLRGDAGDTFFVCLRGWTVDGRQPELARLPHDHLHKICQAKRRADAKAERRRAKAA